MDRLGVVLKFSLSPARFPSLISSETVVCLSKEVNYTSTYSKLYATDGNC